MSVGQVITRAQWGARAPRSVSRNIDPSRLGMAIHYNGTRIGAYTPTRAYTLVRGIQAFHMDSRGWADVAYNAIVDQYGRIFVCRWYGVRSAGNGTNDSNHGAYAIMGLLGEGETPTNEMRQGLVIARRLFVQHGGARDRAVPHSDYRQTACPGPLTTWVREGMPVQGAPSHSGRTAVVTTGFSTSGSGYWLIDRNGGVFTFGDAYYHTEYPGRDRGSLPALGISPAQPIIAGARTPSGQGYLLAGRDGGVFTFGDARYRGNAVGKTSSVVGMAAIREGYWLAAADGGVFSFGLPFHGSMGGQRLAAPIVGIVSTPMGGGYFLVARDGGVFALGDARFRGAATEHARSPIVGMALTPTGAGYWLAAADGSIYSFGNAAFRGSLPSLGVSPAQPIVAIAATPTGAGYWLFAADGGVFAFGDARFHGSVPDTTSKAA